MHVVVRLFLHSVYCGGLDIDPVINARMRRIDLFCKLLGPLIVALINGASTLVAIWVTLGLSAVSIPAEYFCIASVCDTFRSRGCC